MSAVERRHQAVWLAELEVILEKCRTIDELKDLVETVLRPRAFYPRRGRHSK